MRHKRLILVVLVASGFAVGAATLTTRWTNRNAQPPPTISEQPTLTVDPAHLDFGEVWETDKFEWSVEIQNRSARSLTIKRLTSSCSCTSMSPGQFQLDPGATQKIQLIIDLTKFRDGTAAVEIELAAETVDPQTNQTFPRRVWVLRGSRRQLLTERARFLGVYSAVNAPNRWQTAIRLSQPVASLTVDCTGDFRVTAVERIAADVDVRLEFELTQPVGVGTKRGVVSVSARAGGAELPPAQLTIKAEITKDIVGNPPEVVLGGVAVGADADAPVTLVSRSDTPFQVLGVSGGPELVIDRIGDTPSYRVRLSARTAGYTTRTLEFQVAAADGRYPVSVDVSYLGVRGGKDR